MHSYHGDMLCRMAILATGSHFPILMYIKVNIIPIQVSCIDIITIHPPHSLNKPLVCVSCPMLSKQQG